jgi:hypothetical protein
MSESLTIPCPGLIDTKKIFFDKKRMQTAVETVFAAIDTIASAIEAPVFLVESSICGTRIYDMRKEPEY